MRDVLLRDGCRRCKPTCGSDRRDKWIRVLGGRRIRMRWWPPNTWQPKATATATSLENLRRRHGAGAAVAIVIDVPAVAGHAYGVGA